MGSGLLLVQSLSLLFLSGMISLPRGAAKSLAAAGLLLFSVLELHSVSLSHVCFKFESVLRKCV